MHDWRVIYESADEDWLNEYKKQTEERIANGFTHEEWAPTGEGEFATCVQNFMNDQDDFICSTGDPKVRMPSIKSWKQMGMPTPFTL